ncbi:CAP domain-containing protein [Natronorubrum thiooxidans]|uniref:Cysteine-rich secretory protein family protein n=1 Tax=Natronorubrum thiooxidans TaxID=308853 RepID=A0A1N7F730_9EURY|nr:CAP domain-containing protein [Natronorubrum thiooxidans]SIR96168.1 Cysteine-rich secretory protein family protein [Natronorubrum thiooxidans]
MTVRMKRLSRSAVTIAILIALVVSTAGVGAAVPGPDTTATDADTATDGSPFDVSEWLTSVETDSSTTDRSPTTDERLSFVQRTLTNVFSGLFDVPDRTDSPTISDDDSQTDREDASDDPTEREDSDTDESDIDAGSEADDTDNDSADPVNDGSNADDDESSEPLDDADEPTGIEDTDSTDDDEDERPTDESDDDSSSSDDANDVDGDGSTDGTGSDVDDTDEDSSEPVDDGADDTTDDGTVDRALVERHVHEAINEERTARGLEELAFDEDLQEIARSHSEDMAERGYFSHTSPEGDSFSDRYDEYGYECRADTDGSAYYTGGENIAYTYVDQPVRTDSGDVVEHTTERELADGLVEQWMNSDGHRENILADHWTNEGIGIAVTDDDRVYATQNFC